MLLLRQILQNSWNLLLISESGSNRAKALGRLVGIHIIDAAQRATLKDLADYNSGKSYEKDISQLTEELTSYKDIDHLAKISILSNILENLKQKKKVLSKLTAETRT